MMCVLIKEKPNALNHTTTMTSLYQQIENQFYKWHLLKLQQEGKKVGNILSDNRLREDKQLKPLVQALEEIAWKAIHQEKDSIYISQQKIQKILNKAEIDLSSLKDLGLLKFENQEAHFIHLTFEEYLGACYLAGLYETDPSQAKQALAKIKLDPRFSLLLRMTAGCMHKRHVQSFFNDLFDYPKDLAETCELRVLAACFEECQTPQKVSHYSDFISRAKAYFEKAPLRELKLELLHRNRTLVHHPEIIERINRRLSDSSTKKAILSLLERIAERRAKHPQRSHRSSV